MQLRSSLAAAIVLLGLGIGHGRASTFSFTFTPDPSLGSDISASGTVTTDDSPIYATITAATGRVGDSTISSIDDAGINVMSVDTLDAFFAVQASSATVNYLVTITSSAFARYSLTMSGDDGASQTAYGDLLVSSLSPSTVPLPASAPLFGTALLALALVGYRVRSQAGLQPVRVPAACNDPRPPSRRG